MRDPDLRRRLLSEEGADPHPFFRLVAEDVEWLFPLGDPPEYHPRQGPTASPTRRGAPGSIRSKRSTTPCSRTKAAPCSTALPPTAAGEHFRGLRRRADRPRRHLLGLGDGGAHYGMICDAALPTYFLTHWVGHEDPAKRVALPARDPDAGLRHRAGRRPRRSRPDRGGDEGRCQRHRFGPPAPVRAAHGERPAGRRQAHAAAGRWL